MFLIDRLYFKIKKKEISKAMMKFKKISIQSVYNIIIKECDEAGIDYELVFKSRNELQIKLIGKKEINFLKFHKILTISKSEYDRFINLLKILEVDKGYYITTGVIQQDVYNKNKYESLKKSIVLVDGLDFVKNQILFKRKKEEKLLYKNIKFKKYLPK